MIRHLSYSTFQSTPKDKRWHFSQLSTEDAKHSVGDLDFLSHLQFLFWWPEIIHPRTFCTEGFWKWDKNVWYPTLCISREMHLKIQLWNSERRFSLWDLQTCWFIFEPLMTWTRSWRFCRDREFFRPEEKIMISFLGSLPKVISWAVWFFFRKVFLIGSQND